MSKYVKALVSVLLHCQKQMASAEVTIGHLFHCEARTALNLRFCWYTCRHEAK